MSHFWYQSLYKVFMVVQQISPKYGGFPPHQSFIILWFFRVLHEFTMVSARKLSFGVSLVISVRCLLPIQLPGSYFLLERKDNSGGKTKSPEARVSRSQAGELSLHKGQTPCAWLGFQKLWSSDSCVPLILSSLEQRGLSGHPCLGHHCMLVGWGIR